MRDLYPRKNQTSANLMNRCFQFASYFQVRLTKTMNSIPSDVFLFTRM